MIQINRTIAIDENELEFDFVRSSGPGGQNVNKVATAVQLRFDVTNSPSLPEEVRRRLARLAGSRMTKDGVLVLEANEHRTQEKNRQEAIDRLVALVQEAAKKPKVRKETRVPESVKRRRLEEKRRHSERKRLRQRPRQDWG